MGMFVEWIFFVLSHVARIITDILSVVFSPFIFLYYIGSRNSFFTKKKTFKTILITGGSSGIGLSIAKEFISRRDRDGKITIIITGRNGTKLETAKQELERFGAGRQTQTNTDNNNNNNSNNNISTTVSVSMPNGDNVQIIPIQVDVTSKDEMKQSIEAADEKYNIDLIIANAGITPEVCESVHYTTSSKPVLDINVQGVLNTLLPIIPKFEKRKQGHIAIMGSLSGHAPGPLFSHYGPSKAYVRFLSEDLRPKLKFTSNVDVTYIAPGFIVSNLTATWSNDSRSMPGIMESSKAAKIIVNGLINNYSVIMFPTWFARLIWFASTMDPMIASMTGMKLLDKEEAIASIGFFSQDDETHE